jgi:hypothetical protein
MIFRLSNSCIINLDHIVLIELVEDTVLHLRVVFVNGKEIELIKETAEKLIAKIDEPTFGFFR